MAKEVFMLKNGGQWKTDSAITKPIKERLTKALNSFNSKLDEVNIYLMEKAINNYDLGRTNSMNVYVQVAPKGDITSESTMVVTKKGSYYLNFISDTIYERATFIKDESGTVVAEYIEENNEVYIPIELESLEFEDAMGIVEYVVNKVLVEEIAQKENDKSWVKARDKEKLKQQIIEHLSNGTKQKISRAKDELNYEKNEIESYQRRIKERYEKYRDLSKKLIALENEGIYGLDEFISGLDLISNFPDVSNVVVEKEMVNIHVDNVHATAYVDGKERNYYIGNMIIKVNMSNSEVRFDGDNKREGYWGSDPHPHVDGGNGTACLGNVATTIAQLCSESKIYPLFLVCLDFLRNANTEDSAGRHIIKWDEIDEKGNVVKNGKEKREIECSNCEDDLENDSYTVYTSWNGSGFTDQEEWCSDCYDDSYYVDEHGISVSESAYAEYMSSKEDGEGGEQW